MANKFTKDTPFTSEKSLEYDYEDMRGKHWLVKQPSTAFTVEKRWVAYPKADAREAYQLRDKMFAASTDAAGMVDVIEENIEAARAAGQSPGVYYGQVESGFPWWLVLLGAYLLTKKKGR